MNRRRNETIKYLLYVQQTEMCCLVLLCHVNLLFIDICAHIYAVSFFDNVRLWKNQKFAKINPFTTFYDFNSELCSGNT